MEVSKTILVTGCSSRGIGAAVALALANRNNHVFATARNISKIPENLTSLQNVTVLSLDVTSETSVASAVKAVESHGRGLDVLINNAAIGYTMPLLDIDLNHAHQVYETNVWGVLRVIQGFKDLLVKSHGKIVNIASVGGATHTPWIGIYASSKAAILNLSETIRLELSPFRVSVLTIMAGTVESLFHANEIEVTLPSSSYYTAAGEMISKLARGEVGPKGTPLQSFAQMVVEDIDKRDGVVWRGANSSVVYWFSKFSPGWLVDYLLKMNRGFEEIYNTENLNQGVERKIK